MGQQWQVGGQTYEDCDHCGLSFNVAGQLRFDHANGKCVDAFGRKEDKAQNGQSQEAETWCASRKRWPNTTSGHVVESSQDAGRERTVESGWA